MENLLKKRIYVFAKLSKKALSGKNSPLKDKIEEILLNLNEDEYNNIYIPDDIFSIFCKNANLENEIEEGLKKLSDSLPSSNKFKNLKNILNKENIIPPKLKVSNKTLQKKEIYTNSGEVLIMGGSIINIDTNIVTKMIIDENGNISFEDGIPMIKARSQHNAVYHGSIVYSIGSRNNPSNCTIESFNKTNIKEKELSEKLSRNLYNIATVIFNNKLLIIGGYFVSSNANYILNTVYEIDMNDIISDNIKFLKQNKQLNTPRQFSAAITFDNKVFVCGGKGFDQKAIKSVEVFDPSNGTGAWQIEDEDHQMTKGRWNFSLFVFNNELYAVGGDDDGENTTIEKRDKVTMEWKIVTNHEKSRQHCASVLVGSKIFLLGGEGNELTFDFFDLESKVWQSSTRYTITKIIKSVSPFQNSFLKLPRKIWGSKAILVT
jgi:hypothetical protein